MGPLDFRGRSVAITGAGSGLGRAYALELARRGAAVLVNNPARGATDKAERVAGEIQSRGGRAAASHADAARAEGGEAIVRAALEEFGRLDAVIHSAGILRDRTVAKLEPGELREVLDVHLLGAFHLVQPAFRAMRAQGGGSIVLTTSAAGLYGNPGQANYAAAKMGLVGLSSVVALEGARYGIRSNVVSPFARTPLAEAMLGDLAARLDPEHVAALVVYLVSPQCSLTRRVYAAGGGHFARVVVGRSAGWTAPAGQAPAAEDVAQHMAEIDELGGLGALQVPESAEQEIEIFARKLRG